METNKLWPTTIYQMNPLCTQFKDVYSKCIDSLLLHKTAIQTSENLEDPGFHFLLRCLKNRLYLLELMQIPTYQQKHQFRDSIMAENINWLVNEYIPNQKYIIWGADIHVSKNVRWEALGKEWTNNKSMIEHMLVEQNTKYSLLALNR